MRKIFNLAIMVICIILCAANFSVALVDYPTKTITIIVPQSPGGIGDLLGRTFASVAEKHLGKPIVVVNKPGATGQIGLVACSQASPDGHTISVYASTELLAIEWEIANGRKPLVTRNDFIIIGGFNLTPFVIAVPYNSPWKTLTDLINDAKSKPGSYSFGTGGIYGAHHVAAEYFMRATGLKIHHVPFEGGGKAISALVGGHIDLGFATAGSTIPLMRGNKLRILAVLGDKRYKFIQEIPTAKELGIKDVESYACVGMLAPQKTPMPIMEKIREVFKKVVEDKSFIDTIEKAGEGVQFLNSEELTKFFDLKLGDARELYKQLIETKR